MRELINGGEVPAFAINGKIRRYIATADLDHLITRGAAHVLERMRQRKRRSATEDAPAKCGVYMLLVGGAVTYIGRSGQMHKRVQTHRASGRLFDEVRAIPCDLATSIWLERELIRTLQPPENITRFLRRAKAVERKVRHIR